MKLTGRIRILKIKKKSNIIKANTGDILLIERLLTCNNVSVVNQTSNLIKITSGIIFANYLANNIVYEQIGE